MKQFIRIASGQGFWGDLLTAPIDQVESGGTKSLKNDAQGKSLGAALLRMEIDINDSIQI